MRTVPATLSAAVRPMPAAPLSIAVPAMPRLSVSGAVGLQLLPLLGRELAANGQKEAGVGLFQFGAGLRNLVDLRQNLRLIRRIIAHQREDR